MPNPRLPSIRWYRWLGLAVLTAAIVSLLTAIAVELASPGAPGNRPIFWAAGASCFACLVLLPVLLVRAIRVRGLVRKQWRLVMMRAIWGGPFGTLGALWDLCASPDEVAPRAE
ncbi:MAG: hypothetical protein ABIV06_14580 [Thermoanaerobaculia bacterium]